MSLQTGDIEVIAIFVGIAALWILMFYALAKDWKHIQALEAPV